LFRGLCLFVVIIAITGIACGVVNAAQELTLSLEAPSLHDSTKTPASSAPSASTVTQSGSDNKVKVGQVGIVQVSQASIYKYESPKSRLYASVKAETPLAIVKDDGDWYGVLMINGATGWIAKKNVRLIGYDLIAKKSDLNRGSLPSRGSQASRTTAANTDIIRTAMQYAGVPYVFGGTSPTTGMDCSAFVRLVFKQYGVNLPRTAREQALIGENVPFDQLQPGDRLYFSIKNSYVDHCGIYAGNGYFIHCSPRKDGVGADTLTGIYATHLVAARRS